jgi:hypothetical protein
MSFNEAHYAEGRLEKEDINALKNYEQYYITAIVRPKVKTMKMEYLLYAHQATCFTRLLLRL